jgi:Tfp pilus assembly protein PilF
VFEVDEVRVVGTPVASASVFVATFLSLVALIAGFFFLDIALARADRHESSLHAAQLYGEGNALLPTNPREASDRFASAHAIDRGNARYALGLAQAMMADGRNEEAEQALSAALEHTANDGPLNLQMARLYDGLARPADATVYYHRAIFGRWGADSAARRTDARLELVELLARHKDGSAMLAELLPLQAALPETPAVSRRLAHLFLRAGSPRRAVPLLRELLRADPRDADAYAGMGEAALALGNFVTARADFAESARLRPADALTASRLALADPVLSLDPDARRLDDTARAARVHALLTRALTERERCAAVNASDALADSARASLAHRGDGRVAETTNEALRLTSAVWSARPARCVTGFTADEVLAAIMGSRGS